MQGSIESAAKWLGGCVVIASLILALGIKWAACGGQQAPRPVPAEPHPPVLTDLPQPGKMRVVWNARPQTVPDAVSGRDLVGLLARVYPAPSEPEGTVGDLMVELFDQTPRNEKEAAPLEKWVIDPETLKKLQRKDQGGPGYTVFLPWGSYRPGIERVAMVVRYGPPRGSSQINRTTLTLDHRVIKARRHDAIE